MKQQQLAHAVYSDLKHEDNIHLDLLDQITKDIKRTFFPAYHKSKLADNEDEVKTLEKENEDMREMTKRILIAYAAHDKTIGYIQGFNSIVAALIYCFHMAKQETETLEVKPLLKLDLKFDEEEVFYTFLGMMTLLSWRETFLSGMDEIASMCDEFANLMKKEDPKLYNKFFSNHVKSASLDPSDRLLRSFFLDDLHAHHASRTCWQNNRPVLHGWQGHDPLRDHGSSRIPKKQAASFQLGGTDHVLPQKRSDARRLRNWLYWKCADRRAPLRILPLD